MGSAVCHDHVNAQYLAVLASFGGLTTRGVSHLRCSGYAVTSLSSDAHSAGGGSCMSSAADGSGSIRQLSLAEGVRTLGAGSFDVAVLSGYVDLGDAGAELAAARTLLRADGTLVALINQRCGADDFVREVDHVLRASAPGWRSPSAAAGSTAAQVGQVVAGGRFRIEAVAEFKHSLHLRHATDLRRALEWTGLPPTQQPGVSMNAFTLTKLRQLVDRRHDGRPFPLVVISRMYTLRPVR